MKTVVKPNSQSALLYSDMSNAKQSFLTFLTFVNDRWKMVQIPTYSWKRSQHPPRGRPWAVGARSSLAARRRNEQVHWLGWGRGLFACTNLQAWGKKNNFRTTNDSCNFVISNLRFNVRYLSNPSTGHISSNSTWRPSECQIHLLRNKGTFYFVANGIIDLIENLCEKCMKQKNMTWWEYLGVLPQQDSSAFSNRESFLYKQVIPLVLITTGSHESIFRRVLLLSSATGVLSTHSYSC